MSSFPLQKIRFSMNNSAKEILCAETPIICKLQYIVFIFVVNAVDEYKCIL